MPLHPERVHIIPVRYEYDRVIHPLAEHGFDQVYLLYDERLDQRPSYHDEIESHLRDKGLVPGDTLRTVECNHGDPYELFGLVTTIAARHPEASVGVNLATGSKLAAIGAALGCMDADTDAKPYFPHAETRAHDGQRAPATSGYTGDTRLIDYPIKSPTRQQLAMLAVTATEIRGTAVPNKRMLIERGVELGLTYDISLQFADGIIESADGLTPDSDAMDWASDLTNSDQVSAYSRLESHVIRPLETREYVTLDETGRNTEIRLTQTGRKTLEAFRHKITDVLRALDEMYPRHGSPGAELPSWLESEIGRIPDE